MTTPRLTAWILLAVFVSALVGWVAGATGRSDREQERRLETRRADLAEVRALILDGRVALYQLNFGVANQHFAAARVIIERVQAQLREVAQAERAGRLEIVLAHLRDAQNLAAAFDPAAHAAADEAIAALR